jgi:hypothetical protein
MIVLIPPLKVYSQINMMVAVTVTQKGIPRGSKTSFCSTIETRNSLKLAPMIRLIRKNEAPVL